MRKETIWIASPKDAGAAAYTYKKAFAPKEGKTVRSASISASAIGVYTLFLNGKRLGPGVLMPGWTNYNHRVQYQTYDVTSLLASENEIEIGLGQGWAVGYLGYAHQNHTYADHTSLVAWLSVIYTDGTEEWISTDESWEVYTSEVLSSEIYHGETVDKTAEIVFVGNAVRSDVKTALIPQVGEWITEHERLKPVAYIVTPKGERVIDFGQNLTGYVEVSVKAPRGSRIVLHHAEVLDSEGNFYTDNYRTAKNENVYVCSGEEDVFKPSYTFQGFRYIKLEEFPDMPIDLNAFRAIAVHSDMKRTGRFASGNEKINQLYHNIVWGQKSNYLDIPTDCPQRDERLGWTGDAQVFCRTAAINYDVERFFEKWLGEVRLEQGPGGEVYGVVPDCMANSNRPTRISAAWGDVACIVPWQLYLAYGNKEILKKNFDLMKNWVGYQRSAGTEEYLWLTGYHYGDWLAMDAGADSYVGATANDLIASAFFAYSTSLVIKAGEVLGEDVSEYRELYQNVVSAFRSYFMENGMPKAEFPHTEICNGKKPIDTVRLGMTQTALVLILHFNLCTEEERQPLADQLAKMIRENGNRMTTGFVGTPYILHVLSAHGYTDLAYTLLYQEENPSWLYSVCHGATTMWEHWNSLKEDGSFWSTAMNSFNHYAYGAVYDWIFGVAAGIQPKEDAPGYREITLAPHPDAGLGFLDTSYESKFGTIRVHWYYKGDKVYYEFEIPAGVTAYLTLPSGYTETLSGGTYSFAE